MEAVGTCETFVDNLQPNVAGVTDSGKMALVERVVRIPETRDVSYAEIGQRT